MAFHVNIFNNVINHPIWVVGIEYPDQHIRCELRTSDNMIKVNTVAQQFGGGGHDHYAGATFQDWIQVNEIIEMYNLLVK